MSMTVKFPRKLSQRDFEQWLETKVAANKYVGTPNDPNMCPFAPFMNDNGSARPAVYTENIGYYPKNIPHGVYFDNPKWLSKFIIKLDEGDKTKKIHSKKAGEGDKTKKIHSKKALAILKAI